MRENNSGSPGAHDVRRRHHLKATSARTLGAETGAVRFWPYSGWMPASLTILPHLPSWTLTKSSISLGEPENASKPTLPSFDLISGSSMSLRSPRLSCVTIAGGVWAGPTMPAHESMSKPVTPASSSVGSLGNSELRCRRVTASPRNAPDRTFGRPFVRSVNIIDPRPASTAWRAGGELLYGTC